MLKSLKYLILSSTIAFTPTYQIDGMTRVDNTLSINEEMNTLLLSTNKSLPNNLKVSSIVATSEGFDVYLEMDNEEVEKLTREQLDQIHTAVIENYCYQAMIKNTNEVMPMARPTYENVYGTPIRKTFAGYAGNQPSGGNRFATGGGFYYSDSGGPTVSLSIAFASPYGTMSVGASLGNVSTTGKFVTVPDTVNYYKLYVEKTYDCKPYITYYTNSLGETSIFAKGTTKILYNQNQYAKKV